MKTKLIVGLDVPSIHDARGVLRKLSPVPGLGIKVGMQLFTAVGPEIVREAIERGFFVFLDLKFKDIKNTVKEAAASAARLGAGMVNVHADGGIPMMQAARAGVDELHWPLNPLIIGVTVLTDQVAQPGEVLRLAKDTMEAGLDGVVCSGEETAELRRELGQDAVLVVPAVRFADGDHHEQQRVVTPAFAAKAGANYIVMARPILLATNLAEAACRALREMEEAVN